MNKRKTAIILAAGMGTRLQPLTNTEHKCMTKVCGTPIIYNTLKILEKNGVLDVVIVLGYLKEQVQNAINDYNTSIKVTYAYNDEYNKTNTVVSLKKALDVIENYDELYVIEGDVFFSEEAFVLLNRSDYDNATILEPYNQNLEGTFADINKDSWVVDWRHKSDQDEMFDITTKFKTVNLHKFTYSFVKNVIDPLINKTVTDGNIKYPIEKVMKRIVETDKAAIKGIVLQGEKWYEIDDLNDLKKAEELFGHE